MHYNASAKDYSDSIMWYLPAPKAETLNWFEKTYLDAIADDIQASSLRKAVKEIIMPSGGKERLRRLLLAPPSELYPLNVALEKEIAKIGKVSVSKRKILVAFDYSGRISADKKAAYDLAKRIGTRTCVYCNRIYSFTVETEEGKTVARPDFDHWLPKNTHPLLSMSFYNLIPSCPICNRSIKLRNDFKYGKHVHPYSSKQETTFHFQYEPAPNGNWKLKLADCTPEEFETAQLLKTEEAYQPYANHEVKDILDFIYKNTPEYLMDLKSKVMKAYGGSISKEHAFRLVFGTELDSSLFSDRPLSKMKRDVLKQLQEALGLELLDFDC